MAAAQLEQRSAGVYQLNGELSFATVTALLQHSRALFAGAPELQIDLSGVVHADSAGLSLLIEWLRQARLHNQRLTYVALPAQLQALAGISEVGELFTQSV